MKKNILSGSRHVVNEITPAMSFVCVYKFTKSATLTTTINAEFFLNLISACPCVKILSYRNKKS